MARTLHHPEPSEFELQQVLEALVDPVRRSIVQQLGVAGLDIKCGDFEIAVHKSTATHHFKVLRGAGLIRQYYVGTSRFNALRRADIDQVFPGLLAALTTPEAATR